ncbi:mRNA decay factor CTH1 [Wickerhamiella sorbophila]|uniref:mRNA decay factor CTH1 n=1 Tax=Wickerhamiella sorbophila TaxID=45607 RepID=A0A2T0FC70_9ASCO|nr:mRNA decay factor CTH1 [Wickerhamiella sorbophila]PRT52603.1 mRNA decay factor CTH1 [Wickerhamiella sorbophila]
MATASHGHIPDLSATLNESRSCAPLSDLWNLPQSKLFPAQSAPVSGTSSVAPSAPGSVPATPPATAASASGPQVSNYFGSLWAPAPQAGTPAAPPTTVAPTGAATAAASGPAAPGVPNVGLMAPGAAPKGSLLSPAYRAGVTRGIWGPRDDGFGYRQTPTGAAAPAAVASPQPAIPGGLSTGPSLIPGQAPPQPGYVHGPANRNYLGGWLDASSSAAAHSPPPAGASSAAPTGLALGGMNHVVPPVGAVGSSVVAPVGSPINATGPSSSGLPTTPSRFSTPTGSKPLAVGVHTPPHASAGSGHAPVGSSASSTSSTSSNSSTGPGISRPPKKSGRPSTNTELYKTELCASYMSTGGNCPYGEKCQFAHGTQELKTVDRPPKWRSKPCQNWVKTGSCSYNERCCFRHDVPVCPQ